MSSCRATNANKSAAVTGNSYGRHMGWFLWPFNFDPVWLVICDGFKRAAKAEEEVQP